jgi:hypothetical protein
VHGGLAATREASGNIGAVAQAAATGTLQAAREFSNTTVRATTEVLVGVVEGGKEVLGALLPKAPSGTTEVADQATAITEPSTEASPTRGRPASSRRTQETAE